MNSFLISVLAAFIGTCLSLGTIVGVSTWYESNRKLRK